MRGEQQRPPGPRRQPMPRQERQLPWLAWRPWVRPSPLPPTRCRLYPTRATLPRTPSCASSTPSSDTRRCSTRRTCTWNIASACCMSCRTGHTPWLLREREVGAARRRQRHGGRGRRTPRRPWRRAACTTSHSGGRRGMFEEAWSKRQRPMWRADVRGRGQCGDFDYEVPKGIRGCGMVLLVR